MQNITVSKFLVNFWRVEDMIWTQIRFYYIWIFCYRTTSHSFVKIYHPPKMSSWRFVWQCEYGRLAKNEAFLPLFFKDFVNFLGTAILSNTSKWLLLYVLFSEIFFSVVSNHWRHRSSCREIIHKLVFCTCGLNLEGKLFLATLHVVRLGLY